MPTEPEDTLTNTERLQALLYQYLALYERWSEDRQIAAKRAADHAEMVQQFSTQLQAFKAFVPHLELELVDRVRTALASAVQEVGEPLQNRAKENLDRLIQEMDRVVYKAHSALSAYQTSHAQEVKRSQWKVISIAVAVCILLSGLAIKMATPKSLTAQEIQWMYSGQLMDKVYPRLSSQEQAHWKRVAGQVREEEQVR
jgi:hypothetical protein